MEEEFEGRVWEDAPDAEPLVSIATLTSILPHTNVLFHLNICSYII